MKETVSVVVSSRKNSKNEQVYKYQECWKYFTDEHRIGWCAVGSNQCHAIGHSLHFCGQELFVLLSASTIYRAVKWLKDNESSNTWKQQGH